MRNLFVAFASSSMLVLAALPAPAANTDPIPLGS